MAKLSTISIKSYEAALAKAKELDDIAEEIDQYQKASRSMHNDSVDFWKGKAADEARKSLMKEWDRIEKIENEVRSAAKKIRTAVKILQQRDAALAARNHKNLKF